MDNLDLEISYGHLSIEFILKKIKSGDMIIPKHQRPYVWDSETQKIYIESLFHDEKQYFPIVLTSQEQILHVQDGRQRIETISKFINGEFMCNDKLFNELSKYDQMVFMSNMLYCEIVKEPSEIQVAKIYKTLNSRNKDDIRFHKFSRIVLRDSHEYHPDTVEYAKIRMRELCPHKDVFSAYVETGLDGGENVVICNFCGKGV